MWRSHFTQHISCPDLFCPADPSTKYFIWSLYPQMWSQTWSVIVDSQIVVLDNNNCCSGASTYQGHTFQLCCPLALGTWRIYLSYDLRFWKALLFVRCYALDLPLPFYANKVFTAILSVCAWLLSQARLWEPSNRMLGRNTWPLPVRAAPG